MDVEAVAVVSAARGWPGRVDPKSVASRIGQGPASCLGPLRRLQFPYGMAVRTKGAIACS